MYRPVRPYLNADIIRLGVGRVRLQSPSGRYCVLSGADAALTELLAAVNGLHDWDALLQRLNPETRVHAGVLLEELSEFGMVCESTRPRRFQIQFVGSGRLARSLALALLDDPRVNLQLTPIEAMADAASAAESLFGTQLKSRRVEQANRVLTGVHWGAITRDTADMVVVCPQRVEADQAIIAHLMRVQIPHLVVTAHRDTARIGPLVDGYGGACAACANQEEMTADRDWLPILAELTEADATPNDLAMRWVSAEAALRISWFIDGTNTLRSTLLEVSTRTPGIVTHTIARNRDCSCNTKKAGAPKLRIVRPIAASHTESEMETLAIAA